MIDRVWAMPSGDTFTIPPIKSIVHELCSLGGVIVDPFSRRSPFGNVTNDINPEMPTDYHMDALEFLKTLDDESADIVLYDPPYSITQAAELYSSYGKDKLEVSVANMRYWSLVKDNIARILKQGGRCLCCGWNTNGLGKSRNCVMDYVLIVAHGGSKNDTLVTLETKVGQERLAI